MVLSPRSWEFFIENIRLPKVCDAVKGRGQIFVILIVTIFQKNNKALYNKITEAKIRNFP